MSASARCLRKIGERDRIAAEAARQRLRVFERAVGDDQAPHARFGEMPRGELDRLAGADQQHAGLAEIGEHALGEPHRGERDRHRIGADARVRAHALGDRKGLLEQAFERRAQRLRVARERVGVLDLAEDLRLAQHHRFEPGRDAEQMAHGIGVRVQVKELVEALAGQLMMVLQPVGRRRLVAALDRAIELGAVAGRKDRGFAHARLGRELGQRRGGVLRRERDALAKRERRGQVVQSDGDQRHVVRVLRPWARYAANGGKRELDRRTVIEAIG